MVGDGEAETGPLAASWHSNKFLNPARDGAVLPILHLNGYKIANPTVLARIPRDELRALLEGYGYAPRFVEGDDPATMHQLMAATLDEVARRDRGDPAHARARTAMRERPRWPMIVLRTPKGWTGPKVVDGLPVEGSFRSHQVPLADVARQPRAPRASSRSGCAPTGRRSCSTRTARCAASSPRWRPRASGGWAPTRTPTAACCCATSSCPTSATTPSRCPRRGDRSSEATRVLGTFLRDVMRANPDNFRIMGPDETASNRLGAVFEVTDRAWEAELLESDDHLAPDGRVMEVLSEHLCQGWLEGYLLTGRHGLFNCYEAFIHIIDSMFNQHAKWLKVTREIPWRAPIASLNYLLSSHVWRQDHNGFSHQDPGFIDHVVNKKAEIVRVYLPPDANCLLSVADHCLR